MQASVNSATYVSGSQSFTVGQYSLRRDSGERYESSVFKVGEHEWSIVVKMPRQGKHIACYIQHGSGGLVQAMYKLVLVDNSGNPPRVLPLIRAAFTRGSCCGSEEFLEKKLLDDPQSKILVNDSFTISCTVSIILKETTYKSPAGPRHLEQDLGQQLLQDCEGSGDVEFDVQGESFRAHKFILAARSPVFRAQFFGPMRVAADKVLPVVDIEPPVFKALLDFIYTDAVTSTDIPLVQHLLVAADVYGLEQLKDSCLDFLSRNHTVETAAGTLALAHRYQIPSLTKACFTYMRLSSPKDFGAVIKRLISNVSDN